MRRLLNTLRWRYDEWRADRDIKAGRTVTFDDPTEALRWLEG